MDRSTKITYAAVALVYAAGFVQGLTLVSFPAGSALLKGLKGFTDSQYGFIFIPQVLTAVIGSVVGGSIARRVGLKALLWAALMAGALSQVGLASVAHHFELHTAYAVTLVSTGFLGLAFGLGAAPLNTYPTLFFPRRIDSAVTALHTAMGLGLSTGPVLSGWLAENDLWTMFPVLLAVLSVIPAVLLIPVQLPTYDTPQADTDRPRRGPATTPILWVFAAIAMLYAFSEATFANWSIVFLHEDRGVELAHASIALSVFWAVIAVGRLGVSLILLKVRSETVWLVLPVLMMVAFLLLPMATGPISGAVLFGFAGLACSGFLPITLGMAARRFPESSAFVTSLMMGSLMVGIGLGSYVIGPLRTVLSLDELYRLSTVYPAIALASALFIMFRAAPSSKS